MSVAFCLEGERKYMVLQCHQPGRELSGVDRRSEALCRTFQQTFQQTSSCCFPSKKPSMGFHITEYGRHRYYPIKEMAFLHSLLKIRAVNDLEDHLVATVHAMDCSQLDACRRVLRRVVLRVGSSAATAS